MIHPETPENFQDWAAVFRDISPLDNSFNGMEDMESWIGFSSDNEARKRYCSDSFGIKSDAVNDIVNLNNEGKHKSDVQCYQQGQGTTVWKSPQEPLNKIAARDVAMASGARRAAGLLPPLGVEAFSTVHLSKLSIGQFCTTSNACQMQIPATGSMPTCQLANATAPMNFNNFTASMPENKFNRLGLPSKVVSYTDSVHESTRKKTNRCLTGSEENSRVPLSTHLLDANSVVSAVSRRTMSPEQCTSDFDFGSEEASAFNTCTMSSEQCTSDFDIASKEAPAFNILAKGSPIGLKKMEQERNGCHKRKAKDGESTADSQNNDASQDSTSMGKRSRTAKVHNLSERRRRNRINEKMKALQELIPNCNKTDKVSMLGEAIDYLKTLQSQMTIMNQLMTTGVQPMAAPTNFSIGAGTVNSGYPILYNLPNQYGFPYIGPSSSLQFLAEAVNTTSMFNPNSPHHHASFSQENPKTSGM